MKERIPNRTEFNTAEASESGRLELGRLIVMGIKERIAKAAEILKIGKEIFTKGREKIKKFLEKELGEFVTAFIQENSG